MFALPLLLRTVVCAAIVYPEQRSDLQRYQDTARCYPDVGEWYLMFRNYYVDADFGGAEECVKFRTFETYSSENYTAYVEFVIGNEGSMQHSGGYENALEPTKSADDRSPMGYGCSYWRRIDTFYEANDCCEFIYAQNCGTSPKYHFYDDSCPL
ncbi:hypothetical protein MTO96_014742 [Rhipicephalus appendiculatus]